MLRTASLFLIIAAAAGCGPSFPTPFTAAQFAQDGSGPALVHFLSQPDASPSVCSLRTRGPHLTAVTEDLAKELVAGLAAGRVRPELWQRCVTALLHDLSPPEAVVLMNAMGRTYRKILKDSDLDKLPARQAQLEALHQVYLSRRAGLGAHPELMRELLADLQAALAKKRVGSVGTRFGEDLLATVELERGSWRGRPVNVGVLDELHGRGEEALLVRFAARLPDEELRREAARRLVRLRIAASPFPELRRRAAEVEATVMQLGRNPVAPGAHRSLGAELVAAKVLMRGVLVRQDVRAQQVTLLGYSGDRPGVSVLPELLLRGALLIRLEGVSRPITLCGPAKDLDPTPCVLASDVKLQNPTAYLDEDGAFHFVEHLATNQVLVLLRGGRDFHLPLTFAGRPLIDVRWGLHFEKPDDLIFTGAAPGGRGPDVSVTVDGRHAGRAVYSVTAGAPPLVAVLEADDLPS